MNFWGKRSVIYSLAALLLTSGVSLPEASAKSSKSKQRTVQSVGKKKKVSGAKHKHSAKSPKVKAAKKVTGSKATRHSAGKGKKKSKRVPSSVR